MPRPRRRRAPSGSSPFPSTAAPPSPAPPDRAERAGLPRRLPPAARGRRHVHHLYVVRTPQRAQLAGCLKDEGVATGIHYPVACHRQPAVEHLKALPLEHTDRIVKEILTLPISAGHTEAEIDEVIAGVKAFFRK